MSVGSRSRPRTSPPPSPEKRRHDREAVGVHFDDDVVTIERRSAIARRIFPGFDVDDETEQLGASLQKIDYRSLEIDGEGVKKRLCFYWFFCPFVTASRWGSSRCLR